MRLACLLSLLVVASGCLGERPAVSQSTTIQTTTTGSTSTTIQPVEEYLDYTSPVYGVRIKYPPGWSKTENYRVYLPDEWGVPGAYTTAAVLFSSPMEEFHDDFLENVNLVASPSEETVSSVGDFKENVSYVFSQTFKDYDLVEISETQADLRKAIKHVFTYLNGNHTLQVMQYIMPAGKYSYVLTYTAEEDKYLKFLPVVEKMFNSFETAYSLEVRTEKQTYLPGEEIRVILTNTGASQVMVKDDLCGQPAVRFLDANMTSLRFRRPSCECAGKPRETLIGGGENLTYPVYEGTDMLGWDQRHYDLMFFRSLCSDPSYEESLGLDKKVRAAVPGDYVVEVDYGSSGVKGLDAQVKSKGVSYFTIIASSTTTTLPKGPFILSPRNRDNVTFRKDDTGFNVTVYNNGKAAYLQLKLVALGPRHAVYKIDPFVFSIGSFENKTVHVEVNPFDVHGGENITVYLDGLDRSVMVTVRKNIVVRSMGGFPSMPVFDPLAGQKKYQGGKKSPWD